MCFVGKMDLELQNWKNLIKSSQEEDERRKAKYFIRGIESIAQELDALDNVRLVEMEDSGTVVLGLIDDLWKLEDYQFPQDRMERLLNLSSIVEFT